MTVKKGILNNHQYTIRYLKKSDTKALHKYINQLSKEKTFIAYQGENISLKEEQKFVSDTIKKIKLKQKMYLVLVVNDQIIGECSIELKDKIFSHIGIFGITIAKKYRGKGWGKLLIDQAIKQAKKNLIDLKIITLQVFSNNNIGFKMYQRKGFKQYGMLPKGIKHKDKYVDDIKMYLKID